MRYLSKVLQSGSHNTWKLLLLRYYAQGQTHKDWVFLVT